MDKVYNELWDAWTGDSWRPQVVPMSQDLTLRPQQSSLQACFVSFALKMRSEMIRSANRVFLVRDVDSQVFQMLKC